MRPGILALEPKGLYIFNLAMWLKDSALPVYPLRTVSDVTECPKPWGNLPLGLGQCVLPGTSLLNQIRTVSDDTERPKMTLSLIHI